MDSAPAAAQLAIQADEEFVAWVNARWVGAGLYRPGAALAVYEVGPLLEPGINRLVARVRSARGEGGLLASIVADGKQVMASGGRCRALTPAVPGIVQGWFPLPGDGRPQIWGLPPTGRWGPAVLGPVVERADSAAAVDGKPILLVDTAEGGGQFTLFAWPRDVRGILRLHLAPRPAATGLLFLGTDVPNPRDQRSERVLVTAENDREWVGSAERPFRYALVAGLTSVRGAEVIPLGGEPLPAPPVRGVFGIRAPPSRSPVEDEIRRRLRGFQSLVLPVVPSPAEAPGTEKPDGGG